MECKIGLPKKKKKLLIKTAAEPELKFTQQLDPHQEFLKTPQGPCPLEFQSVCICTWENPAKVIHIRIQTIKSVSN